ncbi:MAG: MerR family transcriptional regulator [Actinomycetota bacterium]
MAEYRISEVGERTGFTPSTLRYYEEIGLIPGPRRSPSGYRTYDDAHVELLTFVARAKRLGLSLDEINGLATAWRTGHCSTTREQLQQVLAAKLHQIRRRLEELSAFGEQIDAFYRDLAGRPAPDWCGPSCGCVPEESEELVPLPAEALSGARGRTN